MESIKFLKAALLTTGILGSVIACSPKAQNAVELGSDKTAIIGGTQVAKTDAIAKSTVAIIATVTDENNRESQFICTGTLVAANMVVTAGHCIPAGYKEASLLVIFTTDVNSANQLDVRFVTDAIAHPFYGKANELGQDSHDVGVLRFAGDTPAGYEVAKFLEDESVLGVGAKVTLAGFGVNKTDGVTTESDNTLRQTEVQVLQTFGNNELLLDQSQGKGACHGDSGGPAFVEVNGVQYVWGITSRGAGKNGVDDCSWVSVYTKVKAERVFIDAAITYLNQKK